jgi:hypothetical protein
LSPNKQREENLMTEERKILRQKMFRKVQMMRNSMRDQTTIRICPRKS